MPKKSNPVNPPRDGKRRNKSRTLARRAQRDAKLIMQGRRGI